MDDQIQKKITAALNELVKHIPSKKKVEVASELESHILDAYERNISLGHKPNEALEIALKNLGELEALSKEFRRVHPPLHRKVEFWLASAFVLAILSISGGLASLNHNLNLRSEARDQLIDSKIENMVQDQAYITDFMKVAAGPNKDVDAGKDLNSRIPWEDSLKLLTNENRNDAIATPKDLRERLASLKGADWLKLLDEPSLYSTVSTHWLEKLKDYDYWEPFKNSPVEKMLSEAPVNSMTIPVPDYNALISQAQIHLLQGINKGEPTNALRDVRHLTRLLFTNEILVANMSAIRLLNIERVAYDWMVEHHRIKANDWTPFPEKDSKRTKLAVFATMDIFNILKINSYWDTILKQKPIGLCAGLTEGIARGGLYKSLIQERWPLEKDYGPAIKRVDEILETSELGCRLTVARAQWKNYWTKLTPETFWIGEGNSPPIHVRLMSYVSNYPYVRRLSANALNSIAITTTSYWTAESFDGD